ncbi:HAD family hydrolase [Psychrobacter sp. I-STPA6b]|uniref:HAD family hydrolase n=1 Tax=Psychrobacter sp. I-STPA6b TaxID=2585718 RepID=UPI001D0C1B30|nr:HAD family hydrolase [Psychrobacter sp. I-STPA6b]
MTDLVIFDLDHTLIADDSDVLWVGYLYEQGLLDDAFMRTRDAYFDDYQAGTLDIDAFLTFQLAILAKFDKQQLDALYQPFFQQHILPKIYPEAVTLIEQHQARGDTLLLLSATNEFIITPIAHHLGIKNVIGVALETDSQGNFTGCYLGVPSFQQGKVTRLQQWLANQNKCLQDYENSYFYSDSRNDIPLLNLVDCPIATNPDKQLLITAQNKGWQVIHFAPISI